MREHRYRAWHRRNQKMYHVAMLIPDMRLVMLQVSDSMFSATSSEIELLPFTGLKDKTDKEIYEGDIVTSTHKDITPGYKWVVSWKEAGFYPFSDSDEHTHGELKWYGVRENLETFEIIGNIYENPEIEHD